MMVVVGLSVVAALLSRETRGRAPASGTTPFLARGPSSPDNGGALPMELLHPTPSRTPRS